MGLASEVLLEFGKFGHAIAVLLKGGELLVALKSLARLVTSTSNIEVLNGLEELEVCNGGLISTEEHITAQVLNNGPHSLNCGVSANLLVIRRESRSHDFINKGAVDYGEHLVGPRLFLRSAAEEIRLPPSGDVLLNSKRLSDSIFAINDVRKVSEGDLAGFFDSFPLLLPHHVALLLVINAAVVEEVASGVTPGTTTEVPVAKDDLTFSVGACTTTPRHRRTTAHWFELFLNLISTKRPVDVDPILPPSKSESKH